MNSIPATMADNQFPGALDHRGRDPVEVEPCGEIREYARRIG